jgi:hypothetical protein
LTTRRASESIEQRGAFDQIYYNTIARERQNVDAALELVRP